MDTQPTTVTATRIHGFLEREPVVWLSTVRPDGDPHLVPIWFSWDGSKLASIGLSAEEYAATYSQVIRIMPEDFLPWHGRTAPRSVRLAGAAAASIDEPRRDGIGPDGEPVSRRTRPSARPIVEPTRPGLSLRDWLGEPLARGLRGLTGGLGSPTPPGAA
jgi:hypothetical protein